MKLSLIIGLAILSSLAWTPALRASEVSASQSSISDNCLERDTNATLIDLHAVLFGSHVAAPDVSATSLSLPDLNGQHVMSGAMQTRVDFTWDASKGRYKVELFDYTRGWWFAGWAYEDEENNEVYIDYGDACIGFYPLPGGGWEWEATGNGLHAQGTMT